MGRRTAKRSPIGRIRKIRCRRIPRDEALRSSSLCERKCLLVQETVYVQLRLCSEVNFAVGYGGYRELHGEAGLIPVRWRCRAVVDLVRKIGRIEGAKYCGGVGSGQRSACIY